MRLPVSGLFWLGEVLVVLGALEVGALEVGPVVVVGALEASGLPLLGDVCAVAGNKNAAKAALNKVILLKVFMIVRLSFFSV